MFDTSVVTSSSKWIASTLAEEAKYLYGIEDMVGDLQNELECMEQCLQDADANALQNAQDGQLGIFTKKIRELAFRAEDATDTYIFDVSTKIEYKSLFMKFACLTFHSWPVHQLRKEIEAIQEQVRKVNQRLKEYRMENNIHEGTRARSTPVIESYVNLQDDIVVGIDEDIKELAQQLTNTNKDSKVLAIVGTGGAGKTTLATKLYHHPLVTKSFPCKAFVSVSQQWSRMDLLHKIFEQVKGFRSSATDITKLLEELSEVLKENKYLIVLDDVWFTNAWDDISDALPSNEGSRVLMTTRNQAIPLHADTKCTIYEPKDLTKEQKWELFSKIAIEGRTIIENDDEFKTLGRAMLEKCSGLPLAVVTLAGILRTRQHLYQWENIDKALNEHILKGKGTRNYGVVNDMIALSYDSLPTYMKPCFLYMAIFHEDCKIEAGMLITMWVAEGFVTRDQQRGRETIEDAARNVLEELTQRCMVQALERNLRGEIKRCRLHDLMREFCIARAKENRFVEVITTSTDSVAVNEIQSRRVSIISSEYVPENNQYLRTLVRFPRDWFVDRAIMKLESIGAKFKLLRVLIIWGIKNKSIPEQIGNLIHLRYLGISFVSNIPRSVRNLKNLFYFHWCSSEKISVPNNLFCTMEELREVSFVPFGSDELKSLGVVNLRNLQSLDVIGGEWMIKDLPRLRCTPQHLSIQGIKKGEELAAVYQCPSIIEDCLYVLELDFIGEPCEIELLKLVHCKSLWRLSISGLIVWNSDKKLGFSPNLVQLELWKCDVGDDFIEALGQLSYLKLLRLGRILSNTLRQLRCKATEFPKLQKFYLESVHNLEEWSMEEGAMSCLNELQIIGCKKLKRLPESLKSIATLKSLKIAEMPEMFCKRLGHGESEEAAEDSHIIQHIPSVEFKIVLPMALLEMNVFGVTL